MRLVHLLFVLLAVSAAAQTETPVATDKDSSLKPIPLQKDEYQYVQEDETTDEQNVTTYNMSFLLRKKGWKIAIAQSDSEYAPLEMLGAWWLVPNTLLLLKFENGPEHASGMATTVTCVLVQIDEHGYCILKYDTVGKLYKAGMGNDFLGELDYSARQCGKDVEIIRTYKVESSDRDFYGPAPLAVKYEENRYCRQYVMTRVTHFSIVFHHLVPQRTEVRLDLSDLALRFSDMIYPTRDFTLDEVAEFLVLSLAPRYGGTAPVSPVEKDRMIADMKNSNPGIEQWPNMNREIRVPPQPLERE